MFDMRRRRALTMLRRLERATWTHCRQFLDKTRTACASSSFIFFFFLQNIHSPHAWRVNEEPFVPLMTVFVSFYIRVRTITAV